jgi:hypothetical protein
MCVFLQRTDPTQILAMNSLTYLSLEATSEAVAICVTIKNCATWKKRA